MKPGLYERVIDKHLESLLEAIDKDRLQRKPLDEGDSHNILAKNLVVDDPHIIAQLKPYLFAVKPKPVVGEVADITRPGTPLSISCSLTGSRVDFCLPQQRFQISII